MKILLFLSFILISSYSFSQNVNNESQIPKPVLLEKTLVQSSDENKKIDSKTEKLLEPKPLRYDVIIFSNKKEINNQDTPKPVLKSKKNLLK